MASNSKFKDPRYQGVARALGIKSFNSDNDIRQVEAVLNNQEYQSTARDLGIKSLDSARDLEQIRSAITARKNPASPATPASQPAAPAASEDKPAAPVDPTKSPTNPYRVGANPGAYGTEENRANEARAYDSMMQGVSDYMRGMSRPQEPSNGRSRPVGPRFGERRPSDAAGRPVGEIAQRKADDLLAGYRDRISRMASGSRFGAD